MVSYGLLIHRSYNCSSVSSELKQLKAEMKQFYYQVERLAKEFGEFKKVVEATQIECDVTHQIVIELTNGLKEL